MAEEDREHAEAVGSLSRRFDRGFDASVRALEANVRTLETLARTLETNNRRVDALTDSVNEQRREFVEEMRAQRRGLFRMLDRLDDGGGAAPAG